MKQLADGVWLLSGFPTCMFNVYLIRDVLIDAGTRHAGRRILRQLKGRDVTAHALTHVHPDHQGSSNEVCEARSIPFLVPAGDAAAAENPALIAETSPDHSCRGSLSATGRARAAASIAPCGRETKSQASGSWICRATHPDRSASGASRTAFSSSATCSTT
jgi:glyoxylase-like metal-dependent hydrolase (beta-lactamase superfamily II)